MARWRQRGFNDGYAGKSAAPPLPLLKGGSDNPAERRAYLDGYKRGVEAREQR